MEKKVPFTFVREFGEQDILHALSETFLEILLSKTTLVSRVRPNLISAEQLQLARDETLAERYISRNQKDPDVRFPPLSYLSGFNPTLTYYDVPSLVYDSKLNECFSPKLLLNQIILIKV